MRARRVGRVREIRVTKAIKWNGSYFNKGQLGHGLTLVNTDEKYYISPAASKN
jgi:hypothetical protein